jgi:hypothetical protein
MAEQSERSRRARAAARKAEADAAKARELTKAKTAEAEAEKAKAAAAEANARADEIRANAEVKRLDADAAKRADDAAALSNEKLFQTGAQLATYGGGVAAGLVTAKKIDDNFKAAIVAKDKQLGPVAKKIKPLIGKLDDGTSKRAIAKNERVKSQLAAIVKAADKTGITQTGRGSAGPKTALAFLALSGVSRVVGAQSENETVKTIANATATGEAVAAAVIIAKDTAARGSPTKFSDAVSLSTVEEARAISQPPKPASVGAKLIKAAAKLALPVVAVAAGLVAFRASAQAGESTKDAASDGAKATGDVVTGGGFTFYDQARDAGFSPARSVAEATVRGAVNLATFGLFSEKLAVPNAAFLNPDAAARAEAVVPPARASIALPAALPRGDGETQSHTRITSTGRVVNVGAYRTPQR